MDAGSLEKTKNYAFLLLKFRLRSEKELCARLKKKKFKEETIQQVLSFLKDKGFINDTLFAKNWLEERLKRPLGLRLIEQELKLKGIDKEVIDHQISQVKQDYCEAEVIKDIAQDKLKKSGRIEPLIARRRLYVYLLRRGFSPETVAEVISQLCRQTS